MCSSETACALFPDPRMQDSRGGPGDEDEDEEQPCPTHSGSEEEEERDKEEAPQWTGPGQYTHTHGSIGRPNKVVLLNTFMNMIQPKGPISVVTMLLPKAWVPVDPAVVSVSQGPSHGPSVPS